MTGTDAPTQIDLLLDGGWVITVDEERRIFRNGSIAVDGDRIVEVGQAADLRAKYVAKRVIDLTDKVVTPGLINTHRHLLCTAKGAHSPTVRSRSRTSPTSSTRRSRRLTQSDMGIYSRHYTVGDDPLRDDDVRGAGLRGPRCDHRRTRGVRHPVSHRSVDPDDGGFAADTLPDWLKLSTDQALDLLRDGWRRFGHRNNAKIMSAITVEGVGTCTDELYIGAAELAAAEDSLCVYHKATSEREARDGARGRRPPTRGAHVRGRRHERVRADEPRHLARAVRGRDVRRDRCTHLPEPLQARAGAVKGTTQTGKWPELLAAGVPIGLGTDAENASNHADICRSMNLAAVAAPRRTA